MRTLLSLPLFALTLLAGCAGGGTPSNANPDTVSVSLLPPSGKADLDAGQTLNIGAVANNDATGAGCTFSLSGPGTITLGSTSGFGAVPNVNYAAPSTVSAVLTATVTATSRANTAKSGSFVITLYPTVVFAPQTLPPMFAGKAYSATLSATGGAGALKYVLASGALPAGLSLSSSSGVISGTPVSVGNYTFDIQAQDQATYFVGKDQVFTVTVM